MAPARPRALVAVMVVLFAVSSSPARADDPRNVGARRRVLATAASVVPGFLVHGSGLYVAGDEAGARRLLVLEGIGLGMMALGGVPLVASGASRKLSWPAVPLVVSGAGLFAMSWLADIAGASGLGLLGGAPPRLAPVEVELGYAHVRDVHFDYDHFAAVGARFYLGDLRLEPSSLIAMDDDNQRSTLALVWRPHGPTASRRTTTATALDVRGFVTYHRYGEQGFDTRSAGIAVDGRLDLVSLSPSLAGTFLELSTGLGVEWLHYDVGGSEPRETDDVFALLLGSFAAGMRLGQPGQLTGEVALRYDHRRDDLAAGVSPGGQGGGFAGHFGVTAEGFYGGWGARAGAWFGAAQLYQVRVVRRIGGTWW